MIKTFLLSALLVAGLATGAMAQNVAGDWTASVHGQNGNDFTLNFHFLTAGDSLKGTLDSPMGGDPLSINNGTVKDDSLFFDLDFNGNTVHHLGRIAGDSIDLKSLRQDGSMGTLTLHRVQK